jgi:AcrR family transcriptional regulator
VRADAKRNYDRIVEVAREVFREQGYDASLDEVATRAAVGPGTLYRHFPTRDALLDAIMQSWVDRVTEAVEKALAYEGSPRLPRSPRRWATRPPRSTPSARR